MIQDIAPHRLDNQYQPERAPLPGDYVLAFQRQNLLCSLEDHELRLMRVAEAEKSELTYLFAIDGRAFYLLEDTDDMPDGYAFHEIWRSRTELSVPQEIMFAVATGMHLAHWYRMNRHCGASCIIRSPVQRPAAVPPPALREAARYRSRPCALSRTQDAPAGHRG